MPVLLDRDAELAELGERMARVHAGAGRVIVVDGPAGIGKSTLMAAAARSAREDGTLVLRARCSPLEQEAAWGTARQLFDPLRARGDWTELTAGAATLAERALAPERAEPALGGDAMHSAARGLVWLVSNLGERGSTMLVVDDVHWGDAPSLRWLALLAHSLEDLPVGVLCAVRSGEPSTAPELLAELLAVAPEPPVRPRPLGPFATETLVRERFEGGALAAEPDSLLGTIVIWQLIANDELDRAIGLCSALADVARPRGWLIALAHGCMMRAMALVRAGRPRDAEPDARLAFEYKLPVAPPAAMLWCLTFLVDARIELDDLDGAEAALTEAGQLGEPPADALASPLLLQSRARLRLAQHRPEDAVADALASGRRALEFGLRHPVLACWRAEAVEALVALGDVARASELAAEHTELAERLGTPGACGAALRVSARCAADPILRLERAVVALAASPARLEHTRALVDLGAALRRANRRADAREPLRRALEQADRGGMHRLARRARDELNAAGVRPRRSARSGPDALTPAEHRVATLAAQGYSNRAIAERLYITKRTVETHLTHTFQKLDVTTRAQLPAILGAPGREDRSAQLVDSR